MRIDRFNTIRLLGLVPCLAALAACDQLVVHDASSLLVPSLHRSEIVGIVAGFGTTFASLPDLLAMLRTRSSRGMNPRMAAISGAFQVLWVYYGLLILSRPVIVWNTIAVVINLCSVLTYRRFDRRSTRIAPRPHQGAGLT
jgi:uncharacterized protein with PQ loop repeat